MTLQIAALTLTGALVASQSSQAVTQMGRVAGQVIEDGTNTPVAGARVFVVLDDARSAPADSPPESMTDRDGRYQLDALPAGRYRIAAQKAGFAPPMEPSTMQMFEVAAGQALDDLTVFVRRGGAFTGRVLDPNGQPIVNVGVTALLKRLSSNDRPAGMIWAGAPLLMPSGQGETNDLGEFRISGLSPGEYVIVASPRSKSGGAATSSPAPPASTTTTATFYPGTADVSAAQPLTVQSGETLGDLIIQLVSAPAFQVSGVVVDEAGAPVAHVMVMLMDSPRGSDPLLSLVMGTGDMSQSDASGRFTFGGVAAGSYTLRAFGGGVGAFSFTETFGIDSDGTPRADPSRPNPPQEPGTIELAVENANVSDLKIVVPRSQ